MRQWFPVRLHHAAAESRARASCCSMTMPLLARRARPTVQLVLDRPIAAALGDRFVVRDVSAQRTLGGGRFLDLRAPARKRRTPERRLQLEALALPDAGRALARAAGGAAVSLRLDGFSATAPCRTPRRRRSPRRWNLRSWRPASAAIAHAVGALDGVPLRRCSRRSTAFHAENPDLQGIGPRAPAPVACSRGCRARASRAALQRLAREDGSWRSTAPLSAWPATRSADGRGRGALEGDRAAAGRRPRASARRGCATSPISSARPEGDIRRLLKLCARLGRVDEVAHDHFFLRETVREMAAIVADSRTRPNRRRVHRRRSSATRSTTAARWRSRFSTSSTGTA